METIHALIIDDDKDTANLFRTILTLVGFECVAVYTARAALAHLASYEPDIVLLDLRLGLELDGSDILYQIRSNPRFDDTRVIVITAYPGMLEQMDNLADLILLKPVEIDDLKTLSSRLTQIRPKSYLFRDPTTNLYNLSFFLTRLDHAYARSKRSPGFLFTVMVIQCVVGPQPGQPPQIVESELILKRISEVLNKDFRPTDTFGHLEGERVVALYEDLKKPEDIQTIIQRLHDDFQKNGDDKEHAWQVSPIIGAVLNDARFLNGEAILKAAVDALDHACQLKGQYYYIGEPFKPKDLEQ